MKNTLVLAAALSLIAAPAAFAQEAAATTGAAAPAAAAPAAAAKLTVDSSLGALLDDDAAHGVLAKHIPLVVDFMDSGQGDGLGLEDMSLRQLSELPEAQDQGGLTADALQKIEADLGAL